MASVAECKPAQPCQLPIVPENAGGGSGVLNDAVSDQGPIQPLASARAFHVNDAFGVSAPGGVQLVASSNPESSSCRPLSLNTWKRYWSVNEETSAEAVPAVSVGNRPVT